MSGERPLRLGVVGLGRMGLRHLKTVQRSQEFTLACLMDRDAGVRSRVAGLGVPIVDDLASFIAAVDVAIIASSSSTHHAIAVPLLAAGIHCLVEKPLALSLADIEVMQAAAVGAGVVLAVGHSERFNPVIWQAQHCLLQAPVSRIATRRGGRESAAIQHDLDLVQDLLVHDLDWLMNALGQLPQSVRVQHCSAQAGQLNEVRCVLGFSGGKEADLQVSRIAEGCERRIELHAPDERQEFDLALTFREGEPDPLARQLSAFHDAIHGRQSRIARADDARQVMTVIEQVRAQCYQAA